MTFSEWLQYGVDNKFCGDPHCYSHGWPEMDDEEMESWEEAGEVCLPVIRLYEPE